MPTLVAQAVIVEVVCDVFRATVSAVVNDVVQLVTLLVAHEVTQDVAIVVVLVECVVLVPVNVFDMDDVHPPE